MPEPMRIGVIGGGMISQVAHLPFYSADPRCEVVAIAEARPSLVQALGEQYPATQIIPHYREILDDPAIAAVVIVGPRPSMGPLALDALRAGKHVMMRKLRWRTPPRRPPGLVAAAEAANVMLAVRLHEALRSGSSGRPTPLHRTTSHRSASESCCWRASMISPEAMPCRPPPMCGRRRNRAERFAEWPLWPDWLAEPHRDSFAWFVNAGSHDVDLVNFFFAESIEVVSACSRADGAMPTTFAVGSIFRSRSKSPERDGGIWRESIRVLYENGRLAVAIPSPMASDRCARVVLEENGRSKRTVVATGSGWSFERQAAGFLDSLLGHAFP